jgi:DNA primase
MPGRIPDNVLEDILSRIDIVEIISSYIPLKRAGRNFKASCPFHHEKTPSFMVSPDRQIYHCFGCGAGGNVFNFLIQYERLEFLEAVQMLAKKVGITLPESQRHDYETSGLITQLHRINELATLFYEQNLNAIAKAYLLKRDITENTIKLFRLGYASEKWDALISYFRAKNISLSLLEKAGLVLPRDDGGYYDRFRNRIIFPIFDIKSRPIGFGARILALKDSNLSKYVNSPETPIYTKGRNLYGLNFTKDAIRENDLAVIVEGYLDFIAPYQAGLHNIVASLGTALTLEQVRLLKRYTHNAVMIYDPDDAGQMATLRTLDIFIEEGMDVRIVSLPPGFDPDLFVRKNGVSALKEKIKAAENLFDYQLKILKSRHNIGEADGKRKIAAEMLLTLKKVKNGILRSEYIKKLAEELKVAEHYVLDEFNKIKETRAQSDAGIMPARKKFEVNPTEKLLIKLMLEENQLISRIRQYLEPADFQDERTSKIVSIIFDLIEQGKNIEMNKLINSLQDDGVLEFICESAFLPELSLEDKDRIVDDCIRRLKDQRLKAKRQRLHDQIKTAQHLGDEENLNRLMEEFHHLTKKEGNR